MKKLILTLAMIIIFISCSKSDLSITTTDPIFGTWKVTLATCQTGVNGTASDNPSVSKNNLHYFQSTTATTGIYYYQFNNANSTPITFSKLNSNTYRFNYANINNPNSFSPKDNNIIFYQNNNVMVITETYGDVPTTQDIFKTTYQRQ